MEVIPVIDLQGGVVVRGMGGRREQYRPIESCIALDARPATVARAFVELFGFETAYVADLDAIVEQRPDVRAWQEIADAGLRLWLDAGLGNADEAWRWSERWRSIENRLRLVIGLETLESERDLRLMYEMFPEEPPIFSLDMRGGTPLALHATWRGLSPAEIAWEARSAGAEEIIVLDLADVGMGAGPRTVELCRQITRAAPNVRLIAGGGVRGLRDLSLLAEAGCHAALVASALHDRRLTSHDVQAARKLSRSTSAGRSRNAGKASGRPIKSSAPSRHRNPPLGPRSG